MRRLAWTLSIAAALLATFSCAPSDLGSTCRFRGDDSQACGKCIAKSCQSNVDSCCADSVCLDFISPLDTCGNGGACNGIQLASATLASCIASACSDVCVIDATSTNVPDASTSDTKKPPLYTTDCSTNVLGCQCQPSGGSDTACTAKTAGGYCCEGRGWPASGTSCDCMPFTCEYVTGNSFVTGRCNAEEKHTGITSISDAKCCIDPFLKQCECGPDLFCEKPEYEVSECNASVMVCTSSFQVVPGCSSE